MVLNPESNSGVLVRSTSPTLHCMIQSTHVCPVLRLQMSSATHLRAVDLKCTRYHLRRVSEQKQTLGSCRHFSDGVSSSSFFPHLASDIAQNAYYERDFR